MTKCKKKKLKNKNKMIKNHKKIDILNMICNTFILDNFNHYRNIYFNYYEFSIIFKSMSLYAFLFVFYVLYFN